MQEQEVMEWEEYDSRFHEEPGSRSPLVKPSLMTESYSESGEAQEAFRNPFLSAGESETAHESPLEAQAHECNCAGTRKLGFAPSIMTAGESETESLEEAEGELSGESFEASVGGCGGACVEPSAKYEKTIRRRGDPKGNFVYRTEGDPTVNLAIQLYDYDVNAYYPIKERHAAGLADVSEFVVKRLAQTNQPIAITISGLASRTGTAEYNTALSCNRANCVADNLRQTLNRYRGFDERVTINASGQGFTRSVCRGKECELGEFRSVLVQVHAPGNIPRPLPPIDPGWDKYTMRCCSFETKTLLEGLLGDLLKKELPNLPAGAQGPLLKALRSGLEKLAKAIEKELLKKLPKLSGVTKGVTELLELFPAEFVQDEAAFQIQERDKANPREMALCYTGRGLKLLFPIQSLDTVLDDAMKKIPFFSNLPASLKTLVRDAIKSAIPDSWKKRLQPIGSKVPGPPLQFTLKKPRNMNVFKGRIQLGKGIWMPGEVNVEFDGPVWHSFISERPSIESCPGTPCPSNSGFPLTVGRGEGVELFSITAGSLIAESCLCAISQPRSASLRTIARPRVTRSREAAFEMEGAGELEGEAGESESEAEQLSSSLTEEHLSEEWREGESLEESLAIDPYASIRSSMSQEYASRHADEIKLSLGNMPSTVVLQGVLDSPATRQALNAVLLGKAARRSIPLNGVDTPVSTYFRFLSRLCRDVAQQAEGV